MLVKFPAIFNKLVPFYIIFGLYYAFVNSGANNLHVFDSTTTAEILNGDVFFEIIEPSELEYTYRLIPANNFGAPFNESFRAKNVPLVPVQPQFGCEEFTNVEELVGFVALVERGECSFKKKTLIAEQSGARAIIITDTSAADDEYFVEMIDDDKTQDVHIPAAFLLGKNGLMITRTLKRLNKAYAIINLPVNLTFTPIHEINEPPWLGW